MAPLIRPRKIGTGMILYNEKYASILVMLRDDKPSIRFPNQYDLFGGGAEKDETAEQAIIREVAEELFDKRNNCPLRIPHPELFSVYIDSRLTQQHIYASRIDHEIDELKLCEGQSLRWLSLEDLETITVAFDFNPIIKSFFAHLKEQKNYVERL